ncbi:sterigmatocystin 8-O-methyltransferase precursor [Geopyxis carbonaria]|nr:sterigmatocystin 8-O-methyltransferase precursor [Geopyxis carbonaria]
MSQDLFSLTEQVLSITQKLQDQLKDASCSNPREVEKSSADFVIASKMLSGALMGPQATAFAITTTQYDMLALQFILDFKILDYIDSTTGTPLDVIAEKCGIDKNRTGRLLRIGALSGLIAEDTEKEVFQFTPISKALKEDAEFHATMGMMTDEMWRAATYMRESFRSNPKKSTGECSPWKEAFGKPVYHWYGEQPKEKSLRFAAAMEGLSSLEKSDSLLLDWAKSLKAPRGKIIDVGGGRGHIAIELANGLPKYSFEVQDISPTMYAEASKDLSPELRSRISFKQHDFFQPQPLPDTNDEPVLGYILRRCLHNWVDDDAVKIIRTFVPALKANRETVLAINETVMPAPGSVHPLEEHMCRYFDMGMLVVGNSRQRTEGEWRDLVKMADSGLEVIKVQMAENNGTMGLVLVKYTG